MRTVALIGIILSVPVVHAAPPSATHLFPAGGQRGTTVEAVVAGSFDAWPVEVWSSHPGVTAQAGKKKGTLTVRVAPDATPGIAWLRLHDKQGASSLRPFVVGILPEIQEKEPNDDPARAQGIEPAGAVLNGRLGKSGDVDCFAVKLTKGQTLTASCLADQTLKSPMDGVLQVTSADGFVLAQSNDVLGLDPRLTFTAPANGTFIVRIFAFPTTPNSTIGFAGGDTFVYRLTLTTAGFVEHAWPLAVPRGAPGTVELIGSNIPESAKRVPVPTATGDEAVLWHPALAGTASVRLEPHPCVLADGFKEQAPPFTVSGRLDRPGQVAALPFRAIKGKSLVIQIEADGIDSELTPLLRVFDPAGKQIIRGEPAKSGQDPTLTITPKEDGLHRVELSDLYRGGGPRYWYRLRITPPEPGFTLSVPADRLQVTPGKPTDVIVTVTRRNGFTGLIQLSAMNLSAGVSATMLKPAKPDDKTLTLRLTAEKAGPSGAFRIVGQGTGLDQPRDAAAALADLGTTTADLWLTVGGK